MGKWVTRAGLSTGEQSAVDRTGTSEEAQSEETTTPKRSCTPLDTVGRADIDVFTVRQMAERVQRGLAAWEMFFSRTFSISMDPAFCANSVHQ